MSAVSMKLGHAVVALAVSLSCAAEPGPEPAEARAKPAEPRDPEPLVEDAPAPEEAPSPAPEPPPPAPFDASTLERFDARIVDLHDRAGWAACGVIHSVGAVEVELLDHFDPSIPAPHLVLFVSCPADVPNRAQLYDGAKVQVTLHARAQRWPKPIGDYREDLPRRYVKTIAVIDAG